MDNDLLRHNQVVFRGGEGALQVLPPLAGIPRGKAQPCDPSSSYWRALLAAFNLIKDLEPTTPPEYILKGVVHATIGQIQSDGGEHLKLAQQCFQIVGASARIATPSQAAVHGKLLFYLLGQFEDVLVYLKSVAEFSKDDDNFHWNFALASAAMGDYKTAEESLNLIQDPGYRQEYPFVAWLAKSYVNNSKPRLAWELYASMEPNDESFALLRLIADECYRVGAFYYAQQAFDVLLRLIQIQSFGGGEARGGDGSTPDDYRRRGAKGKPARCRGYVAKHFQSAGGVLRADALYMGPGAWRRQM